jgi:hypothetical protein
MFNILGSDVMYHTLFKEGQCAFWGHEVIHHMIHFVQFASIAMHFFIITSFALT